MAGLVRRLSPDLTDSPCPSLPSSLQGPASRLTGSNALSTQPPWHCPASQGPQNYVLEEPGTSRGYPLRYRQNGHASLADRPVRKTPMKPAPTHPMTIWRGEGGIRWKNSLGTLIGVRRCKNRQAQSEAPQFSNFRRPWRASGSACIFPLVCHHIVGLN